MFGAANSPSRETSEATPTSPSAPSSLFPKISADSSETSPTGKDSPKSSRKGLEDVPEKRRRSSAASKATTFLANAKHSLHMSSGSTSSNISSESAGPVPTALQRLGKTDPALIVPQGPLNNSAGESLPGPHSTFRVGVTEDKNKKCRRTMEDTHAYLYNFLSTPAPVIDSKGSTRILDRRDQSGSSRDSVVVETDNGYFAIFDGHAGTFAADWCGKKLHLLLEEFIRKQPNSAIPELLDQTFTSVDQQLQKLPLKNSGCTAICAILRWEDRIPNQQSATGSTAIAPVAAAVVKASEGTDRSVVTNIIPSSVQALASNLTPSTTLPKLQESATRQRVLYTANVGDARIVLCRNGKALRLSYDHKGSDENEGRRITNAGGLILNNRVNGVLAVTRALGDAYMKELITGHPYTTETVIQPDIDEFLILACDGLWDVCSDQDAVDLIRTTHDPQAASKQLVDHALNRFSTDNLSVMVVRFDNRAVKQTIEHTEGRLGVEGDPLSSHGSMSEADHIIYEARKSMSSSDEPNARGESYNANQSTIREEQMKDAEVKSNPNTSAIQS